jgi:tRNA threonylcarbamoyladenosine biosynthesis protein TsaE
MEVLAQARLADGRTLTLRQAQPEQAATVLGIIKAAFSNRPPVQPPPPALAETEASIAAQLRDGFGLLAEVDGEPAGVIIVSLDGPQAGIHRVSVAPQFQRKGIASTMVEVALDQIAEPVAGQPAPQEVWLTARAEFPYVVNWWRRRGFTEVARTGTSIKLHRAVAQLVEAPTAEAMQDFGAALADKLLPGDLIIATGELGAGKTTLAQGIGRGLDAEGAIISPTFVLSRIHPSRTGHPTFVHVDAYRLASLAELEDLDLDLSEAITFVEWGAGLAEGLSDTRIEIDIRRSTDPDDETRYVYVTPIGRTL